MGTAQLDDTAATLTIRSDFVFYGTMSSDALAREIAADIAMHWNEPRASVRVRHRDYRVRFDIRGVHEGALPPEAVWYNTDPAINFFRIETHSVHDVSFVDGIHCNTGYFKADNLRDHSTTAAHEYGHTIGLEHPRNLDIRGKGQPGIMYPRGTLCDPAFQYDPQAAPRGPGGTLNPWHRKVLAGDVEALRLHKLPWNTAGFAVLGDFSSVYHEIFRPGH